MQQEIRKGSSLKHFQFSFKRLLEIQRQKSNFEKGKFLHSQIDPNVVEENSASEDSHKGELELSFNQG
jgi:hypothetical protein